MTVASLQRQRHPLAAASAQKKVLQETRDIPAFAAAVAAAGLPNLKARSVSTLQLNLGKMCNQVCKHCHVDAGPDRKEIMTRKVMHEVLRVVDLLGAPTADLTGGAPEMNPHFYWLVEQLHQRGCKIIVRCNLTIIRANPKYYGLPEFYKRHNIEVVSSLPHFNASRTDKQRGSGVFGKSIEALQQLNSVGYGQEGSGLLLHLVYNPTGSFFPGNQQALERDFKQQLYRQHKVVFNQLFTITNMPISRFLEYLWESGQYSSYMQKLHEAFNPAAVENVMCRDMLSIGYDGQVFDCDFNQMLELPVGQAPTLADITAESVTVLSQRSIKTMRHCYGCTAGAGSSCGGAVA
jgi:radical SAM/Cys-rich protein